MDSDGDGYTNLQEFLAGTRSERFGQRAAASRTSQQAGSDVVISFSSVLGKSYLVERNDTFPLNTWTTVAANVFGHDGTQQVIDIGGGAVTGFYRVQVLP